MGSIRKDRFSKHIRSPLVLVLLVRVRMLLVRVLLVRVRVRVLVLDLLRRKLQSCHRLPLLEF